jgi:hypothetical protein
MHSEVFVACLKCYHIINMDEMRSALINLIHDSQSPAQDSKPRSSRPLHRSVQYDFFLFATAEISSSFSHCSVNSPMSWKSYYALKNVPTVGAIHESRQPLQCVIRCVGTEVILCPSLVTHSQIVLT